MGRSSVLHKNNPTYSFFFEGFNFQSVETFTVIVVSNPVHLFRWACTLNRLVRLRWSSLFIVHVLCWSTSEYLLNTNNGYLHIVRIIWNTCNHCSGIREGYFMLQQVMCTAVPLVFNVYLPTSTARVPLRFQIIIIEVVERAILDYWNCRFTS